MRCKLGGAASGDRISRWMLCGHNHVNSAPIPFIVLQLNRQGGLKNLKQQRSCKIEKLLYWWGCSFAWYTIWRRKREMTVSILKPNFQGRITHGERWKVPQLRVTSSGTNQGCLAHNLPYSRSIPSHSCDIIPGIISPVNLMKNFNLNLNPPLPILINSHPPSFETRLLNTLWEEAKPGRFP